MRVVFVLIAALFAGEASVAAEPDSAGPPQPNAPARHPYPKQKHVRASPITDHFALRGTFFAAQLNTTLHLDSSVTAPGTLLNAEHDLGLKGCTNGIDCASTTSAATAMGIGRSGRTSSSAAIPS
jgi:hypothetical protein